MQLLIDQLPFGKRVNSAVYLHIQTETARSLEALGFVDFLKQRFSIGESFNLVKLRRDEMKLSFLSYPDFFEVAHPELRNSITIDLVTGKARRTDYRTHSNPPILHRKETFLPPDHPQVDAFAALTRAEEEAGLYEQTKTIGFKLNWERLLAEKRLRIEGHELRPAEAGHADASAKPAPEIERHKTAKKRYDLSSPVKTALEHGLLKPGSSFFDYGCGLGSDVAALKNLGYTAEGWDPVHRPGGVRQSADVVNFGYVLNVIEDPPERIETLIQAYSFASRLLIVSGLINRTVDEATAIPLADGVVTKRNTFQKFFEQSELQQLIEDVLECTAIPAALGIFYVFRSVEDQQEFLFRRTRRTIDWTKLSGSLGLGEPMVRTPRTRVDRYAEHQELLDDLWHLTLELGRTPEPGEYPREADVREKIGSFKTAHRLVTAKHGMAALDFAAELRRGDLLVYLALAQLRKLTPFTQLPERLRRDIRAFFGSYTDGLKAGRELLFSTGDPGEIELACETVTIGFQDEQALYIHRSILNSLPPLLRVYAGCAAARYGDLEQVEVIKLHKTSGKVTLLSYDDFDGNPLPELRQRIKVNLRSLFVQVFEYPSGGDAQLLYFKERYVPADHQNIEEMMKLSASIKKLGIDCTAAFGPKKVDFQNLLSEAGMSLSGSRIRRLR